MPRAAQSEAPVLEPHRQLTFDRIVGHEPARNYLREAVRGGRLPQALLLAGPPGVGKRTMAWALAREIVSDGEDPETHGGSTKASRGTHPDIRSLDNSHSPSGQILIDDVRETEDWVATSPLESPKKIVIISPAEQMNPSSANCLLKLLEEPERHLTFILTTSSEALLLPTIRSRCTPVALEAVAQDKLTGWLLERTDVGKERAALAARLSEGRPGHALRLATTDALAGRIEIVNELALLSEHGFAVVFRVADRLSSIGSDLRSTLDTMILILRDALTLRLGLDDILNEDMTEELRSLASGLSVEGLHAAAMAVHGSLDSVSRLYTPQSQMHFLEILVANIGRGFRQR